MGELIQFVPRSTATTGRDALPEHGRTMVLSTLPQKIADALRAQQFETSASPVDFRETANDGDLRRHRAVRMQPGEPGVSTETGIGFIGNLFDGNFVRLEPLTAIFPAPPSPPSPLELELTDLRDRIAQLEAAVLALGTGQPIGIQDGRPVVK